MNGNIIITFLLIALSVLPATAKIDVVYPTQKNITVNSDETYFSGNVDENSSLKINSVPVKLWENRFFVHVVPLEYGTNEIKFEQSYNGKIETDIYTVNRPKPLKKTHDKNKNKIETDKTKDVLLYSKTVKENATVREKPSVNGKRVIDLPKGIVLYLNDKSGNYYKLAENGKSEFWIHSSNIEAPVTVSERIYAKIKKHKFYEDEFYTYHKFYTSHPVFYNFEQKDNNLKLSLFGVENKNREDKNFDYEFSFEGQILGYEGYYDENSFVAKIAKTPTIPDLNNPLKNINIFVDAGHGGSEKGTISPERVFEKDVNLIIANKLIDLLIKDGANVSYSRNDDSQKDLYERVNLAKKNNALISVSIHCNSLPYGKNPYKEHGAEVHYFNENARKPASLIVKNLSVDTGIRNNGARISSFALTRSTNPVSLIVETAYMLNPEEYILLKSEDFADKVAKSIERSLMEYISCIKK